MTGPRVRVDDEGRVALGFPGCVWWLMVKCSSHPAMLPEPVYVQGKRVAGEEWSELLVAELPEPDHHVDGFDDHGGDTLAAAWLTGSLGTVTGSVVPWTNGLEINGEFHDSGHEDGMIERIEADCLRVLAAVAEHRRCAAALIADRAREALEAAELAASG